MGVLLAWLVVAAMAADKAPPRTYTLEVGDQKTTLTLDTPVALKTSKGEIQAVLRVDPFRTFEQHGIRFDFPEKYVYSYDGSQPELDLWNFEGSDNLIMLQKYGLAGTPKTLADMLLPEFRRQYAQLKLVETPIALSTASGELTGTRMTVNVGDVELIQDVFTFRTKNGLFCLVVQDTRGAGEGESAESRSQRARMAAGFTYE